MSEIIYMTGQEIGEAIAGYGQAVSGMSAAEASAALGASAYGTQGGATIISFPMQHVKGGSTVSLEEAYAAQMWEYWKITGAATGTTALGAAAAAAKSWASGVLFGDAEVAGTLAGSGGLLTMSLPAAAAAAAPLLGVSLGAALYESNPELWEKISRTLLPFCYEDSQTIPAVVDEHGQVYISSDLVGALKDFFEQEGIGPSDIATASNYPPDSSPYALTEAEKALVPVPMQVSAGPVLMRSGSITGPKVELESAEYSFKIAGQRRWIAVSRIQSSESVGFGWSTRGSEITIGGVTYYYWTISCAGDSSIFNSPVETIYNANDGRVATKIIYGSELNRGDYPLGTSEWTGDSVDLDSTPTIGVVTDPQTGATVPYFPITLPIGDPVVTPDPVEQPNPIAPVELPQLDPYIAPATPSEMWPEFPEEIPFPTPEEQTAPQAKTDPIYIPQPDLNPEVDPSAEPDAEPDEELPTEPAPPSGGITPPILFPLPETNWPSIVPATGSGLVHVYNPTPSEFIAFGNWLWVTYADPSIEKLWNNPFDGVIGAHELYATPAQGGTDTIKSGFLDSGISSTVVRVRYTSINCGSMVIPEYWGNYLDYSPYSKAFIYLPFIGIVEVDVDDIIGHAINILYHIDSYNGSCIAQITVAKDNYVNTIYQFSGNCAVDIPLAGGSQSAIRAGMISAAAYGIGSTVNGVVNGAAYGSLGRGLVGGVTGAVAGIANGIANVVSQKSTVQHSGSFGASYGAMGIKKPYIIIRRPIQKQVNGYQHDYGFPAHKRVIIGSCTGFLRVREVNVQSTLATDEEKVMIENLLKEGVYIS